MWMILNLPSRVSSLVANTDLFSCTSIYHPLSLTKNFFDPGGLPTVALRFSAARRLAFLCLMLWAIWYRESSGSGSRRSRSISSNWACCRGWDGPTGRRRWGPVGGCARGVIPGFTTGVMLLLAIAGVSAAGMTENGNKRHFSLNIHMSLPPTVTILTDMVVLYIYSGIAFDWLGRVTQG